MYFGYLCFEEILKESARLWATYDRRAGQRILTCPYPSATPFFLPCRQVEEVRPRTSQGSSGRCWIFAGLNAMRIPLMKELNIEEFEFSQSHLFFWDKVTTASMSQRAHELGFL